MKSILAILSLYMSASALAHAQEALAPAVPPSELASIQKNLKLTYPKTRFSKISVTPVPGIYEVVMGRNVAFVDGSGRYFIFGRLFDMNSQEDITSVSEHEQPAVQKVDFASLPLDAAIKSVRGDGRRVLAVFSDPDCPYCKTLEQALATLDDVTIYTFLMPLEQLHPDARRKADAIWCSKDRAAAWAALMRDGKAPAKSGKLAGEGCTAPHGVVQPLAQRLGIGGTPFLVAADGRTMPGAMPAAKLSAWLDAGASMGKIAGKGVITENDKGRSK